MHARASSLAWLVVLLAGCIAEPASDGGGDGEVASAAALSAGGADAQRKAIVATAQDAASDRAPGGRCYAAVARYIDTVGYGRIPKQPHAKVGSLPSIPSDYGTYAHQFADYVNAGDHARALGLTRLHLHDPYDAPRGAIVVVRAGAPGTSHPLAGDISIAAGGGVFYNDGTMSYGSRESFPHGNDFVLGIYVPTGDAP